MEAPPGVKLVKRLCAGELRDPDLDGLRVAAMSLGFEHQYRDGVIVVTSVDNGGSAADAGIKVPLWSHPQILCIQGGTCIAGGGLAPGRVGLISLH